MGNYNSNGLAMKAKNTIAALHSKVKECSKYRQATGIDKANGV